MLMCKREPHARRDAVWSHARNSGVRTFAGIVYSWETADLEVANLWGVWNVGEGNALGELVANLWRRHDVWFVEGVV